MGVISWVWLPGKYLILCYSQSSSQFPLCLNLSVLLSYSNKHFKLPFLCSVYVSCGNTAQTGFVPGNRHSWDMGARHSPGRRHQVCTCLSRCTTSRRHIKQPVKIRGKPNYQNGVYRGLYAEVSEVCQQETIGLGHFYSHCAHLPQNSFS